jgi:hypothetical protein
MQPRKRKGRPTGKGNVTAKAKAAKLKALQRARTRAKEAQAVMKGWPRTVKWNEFTGTVPTKSSRTVSAGVLRAAKAHARFYCTYKHTSADRSGLVRLKNIRIKVRLNSSTSWSDTSMRTAALLKHEQGHYDITGLAGRDLARAMLDLGRVKKRAIKPTLRKLKKNLDALVKKSDTAYDKGTVHGSDKKEQNNWTLDIQDVIKDGKALKDL